MIVVESDALAPVDPPPWTLTKPPHDLAGVVDAGGETHLAVAPGGDGWCGFRCSAARVFLSHDLPVIVDTVGDRVAAGEIDGAEGECARSCRGNSGENKLVEKEIE